MTQATLAKTPDNASKPRKPAKAQREFVPDLKASGSNRFTRKSLTLTIVMGVLLLYTVFPLIWLIINATKTQGDLFSTFGLWFGPNFNLWGNVVDTLTYQNGIFLRWFGNTVFYVVIGAGGATLLATLADYGMAKYRFPGRRAVFAVILGAIAIPATARSCSSARSASRIPRGPSSCPR
jgi:multiple sugar transport system permease protein